ncbi:MAG: acyl-CoA dehydrogenase family protein [Azonexus sp.]|jgi:alkylation response protein AidB-like acyl-CoA dehydrogenase|nr:acyl-CoA dehydrogenase family protein [Azonexus sp.]
MIGFELSEEQRQLQETARRFATKEIKPFAAAVDRVADPRQAYPKEIIGKGFELGFHSLLIPEEYGGMGGCTLDYAVLLEELAAGDIGMANAFHVVMSMSEMIARMGVREQCERWLRPIAEDTRGEYLICFGATEPSGGSEIFCPTADPKLGVRTRAVRDGDDYVINGSKVFSSNASVSKLYGLLARSDSSKANAESCSVFFFAADTPGFSIGVIEDKMGHRASMNGELIFENMRLPKENMLGREGGGFETLNAIYDTNGVGTGAMAVGVARAAYEAALQYAKEREIWGQPIGKYQAVGQMLVDMKADVEMARLIVRRIAWQGGNRNTSEGMLPPNMAKVYPAEMARRVTVKAMQIFGGSGYMKDYPLEKYVRDAMVLPIISGANEVLKHFMAQRLLDA